MLKVSAIITTHNRLELLKRAVVSVKNQTYCDIELLVIDDHSSDGTIEWCHKNNINVLQSNGHGGNTARNLGISRATGDYIAFLDDDDYWEPNKIELQIRLAEESKADVIYCGVRKEIITANGVIHQNCYPQSGNTGDVSKIILQNIFTVTSALMVKKSLLSDVGAFDEKLNFWQEYELCIRLAQKTKFYAIEKILVGYLVDSADRNRLTNKYNAWKKSVRYVHKKHKNLYRQLSPMEKLLATRVEIWDALSRSKNLGLKRQLLMNTFKLRLSFVVEKLLRAISQN